MSRYLTTVLAEWNSWEHGKWTVRFILTLMFTNLNSPRLIAACTCTSQLGCAFRLGRRHCQKLRSRSLFYFKTDIVLCFHSLFCLWNSDFSSSPATKLNTWVIVIQTFTSIGLPRTALTISDSTRIHHTLKWHYKCCRQGFPKTQLIQNSFIHLLFQGVQKIHYSIIRVKCTWSVASGLWGSYSRWHSQTW